jgi:eukaryotic-like serine/threonine-protein kinase
MNSRALLAGRYQVRDRLGQGGMSVVWRARDLALNRDVAVKMLAARDDEGLRECVRAEALAAARLAHPHVARVFDYGEATTEDGHRTPYVVMELLRGTPLSEVPTPMPPQRALQICAEIASALAAAHAQGVIHCDVKPGNVMLTAVGAKVFDFGIASIVAGTDDRSLIDEVVGTPAYLAPEQLTGTGVTPATDVYALGVLLYGLLTQKAPWAAPTEAAMVAAHLLDEPAELPTVDGVTTEIDALYRRCLARDPDQRPAANDLAVAFAKAARASSDLDHSTNVLLADTVQMAPVGIQTALVSNKRGLAEDRRRWRMAAMLLAAGSVAVAVAYVAVDVTPYHVWHVAQLPAAADGGRVTPPETSTVDPEPAMPPTTEPSTPTQTSAEAALAQPAPADPGPAQPLTFASVGGAIVADCHDDRAYLQSWTPTEGFKVKKLDPGPGSSAWVELRNTNVSIVMTVTCASGIPTVAIDA